MYANPINIPLNKYVGFPRRTLEKCAVNKKQQSDWYSGKTTLHFIIIFVWFQTQDLIKSLQELENAASGDAAVRQKIASLPPEVQDVSLLDKITGK